VKASGGSGTRQTVPTRGAGRGAKGRAAPRARPVLERAQARMDAFLGEVPRWTAGKQRLTATQLHRLLRADGIRVGVTLRAPIKHFGPAPRLPPATRVSTRRHPRAPE